MFYLIFFQFWENVSGIMNDEEIENWGYFKPISVESGEGRERSEMNGSKTTSWELKAA
jgi:hypothetical protein